MLLVLLLAAGPVVADSAGDVEAGCSTLVSGLPAVVAAGEIAAPCPSY